MQNTRNKKKLNPRESAAFDLLEWYRTGIIAYRRREDLITPQNYAFYRNLVSSIIRQKQKYEYFIELLTGRSLKKLD